MIVLYSSTFCKSIVLPTASMFTLERGNSLAANIGCLPMDGCFDLSKTGLQQAGIFCNRLAQKKYFGFCKRLAHYRVFFGRLFFISKMPLTILSSTNTKLNMSWFWKIKFPGWPTWPPPTAQCVPTAGEWHLFCLNWGVEVDYHWMAKLFFLALCKLRSYQLFVHHLLIELLLCTNTYTTQTRIFFSAIKCK